MKSITFLLFTMALFSFTVATYEINKGTAQAGKSEGFFVFIECTPVSEYEFLGTVKAVTISGSLEEGRDTLIRKAKKKYPTAEAIILHLPTADAPYAEVIKFK